MSFSSVASTISGLSLLQQRWGFVIQGDRVERDHVAIDGNMRSKSCIPDLVSGAHRSLFTRGFCTT